MIIDVEVDAYDAIDKTLFGERQLAPDNLARWLRNRAAPWLQQRAETRFDVEGDQASGPWAELRPTTNTIRIFQGFPPAHPINVRTGNLKGWLTNDPGFVNEYAYGAKLTWPNPPPAGDLTDKFNTAQHGGRVRVNRQWRSAPARPVVATDNNDLQYMLTGLRQWLKVL